MRIVAWNIRAGGGRRIEAIADQLRRWRPDVVALSEFRGTPPSAWLADELASQGLAFQRTTADANAAATNALLVASRWPVRLGAVRAAPREPRRWLLARIAAPEPIALGAMHVPNRVTGRKGDYLTSALSLARRWREGPALLIGDTNSGRIGLDEQVRTFDRLEDGWIRDLDRAGWADAFRVLHGERRAYTWYSPNGGNGFRLDQAFVNQPLRARLAATRYAWGKPRGERSARRESLSDHAALIVDFAPPRPTTPDDSAAAAVPR
jgi:exonuclease III